jgi:acyl carrier protein
MGLDSVELLMEWEKAFAIEIPDKEAQQIVSVNDATDTIIAHIQLQPMEGCKSQKLFYQFRRYFEDKLNISKADFKPNIQLKEVLPFKDRKKLWREMQVSLECQLPDLVSADVDLEPKPDLRIFGIHLSKIQPAFSEHTIGDFIDYVFALNYQKLVSLPDAANRYEVQKVIIGITSDKMGIPVNEIKPESRFTYDLGID